MNPYFVLKQFIGDYRDCQISDEELDSPEFLKKCAEEAVKLSNTSVVSYLEHKFDPQGYTLLMVLADSSFSLHTWPEEKFISAEIFTCSARSEPLKGLEYLSSAFKSKKTDIHEIKRE